MLGLDINISKHARYTISKMVPTYPFPSDCSIIHFLMMLLLISTMKYSIWSCLYIYASDLQHWNNKVPAPTFLLHFNAEDWRMSNQITLVQDRWRQKLTKITGFNQYLNGINPPVFVYLIVLILCIFDVNSGEKILLCQLCLVFIPRHY